MPETTINPVHLNRSQADKRRFHTIGAIIFLSLLPGASAGIGKAQKTNGSAPPDDLKVMTWNVDGGRCGRNRSMAPFAQVINAHDPDVVAVQEIHSDQAALLANATGLHVYFVQTKDCPNTTRDFGMAILSRHPFDESSKKVYPFYSRNFLLNANNPKDTSRGEFRKMIGVSINVGSERVRIYNTHLTAIGKSGDFLNYYRLRQVAKIRSSITDDQRNLGETFWSILMGDFNSQPGTLAYRSLAGMFQDADPHANTRGNTRVDFVLLGRRPTFTILDSGVLNTGTLSDHKPVITRLSFNLLND